MTSSFLKQSGAIVEEVKLRVAAAALFKFVLLLVIG